MSIGTIKQAERILKAYAEDLHFNGYPVPECALTRQQVGKSQSVQVELTRYQVPRHGQLQNRARLFAQGPSQTPLQSSPPFETTTESAEEEALRQAEIQSAVNRDVQRVLAASINERDPTRRQQMYDAAVRRVKGIGSQAIPELLRAFRHQNEIARLIALNILNDANLPMTVEVFETLLDVLRQETAEIILIPLVNTLGKTGEIGLKAIPPLMKLLPKASSNLAKAASMAIAKLASDNGDGVESYVISKLMDNFSYLNQHLRYNTALSLGQFGPKAIIAAPKLMVEAGELNQAAIWALGKMGSQALSAREILVGIINSQRSALGLEAAVALVRIDPAYANDGVDIIPLFISAITLQETSGETRQTIDGEESLLELAKLGTKAAQALGKALSNTHYSFGLFSDSDLRIHRRMMMIQILGRIGAEAAIASEALVTILKGYDEKEREAVSQALIKIGTPAVLALIKGMKESYYSSRVINVLTQIGYPVIPHLVEALDSQDTEIRNGAVQALENFGPKAAPAIVKLIQLLGDVTRVDYYSSYSDYSTAIFLNTLAKIGPLSIPKLLEVNAHEEYLKIVVSKIGSEAIPELTKALAKGDIPKRRKVAQLFGSLGANGVEAVPILLNTLKDPYEACIVRSAVAFSLGKMGRAAAPAIPDLKGMSEQDTDPWCRKSAQDALNQLEGAMR